MKTIVLAGMPGSGKTTVGKILSDSLKADFVDIDSEIERLENKTINEIFALLGEKYFRDLEAQIINRTFKNENLVMSLGGGAFGNKNTSNFLLANSNVIYLKTSPKTIFERIKKCSNRPLLNKNFTIEHLNNMLQNRKKNYELAHFTIITDNKIENEVAAEILKCVNLK